MKQTILGIDIGGTKIAIGVFDENDRLLAQQVFATQKQTTADAFFDALSASITDMLAQTGIDKIDKIGLGIPGMVASSGREIALAPNIQYLSHYPLCERLEQTFHASVVLENDANAAALAEYHLGAGQGFSNMVFSTISTGIGAGIIVNGNLVKGAYRMAAEVGHMIIVPDGLPCGCGNKGCAEAYAGGANYPRQIEKRIAAGEPTIMTKLAKKYGGIDGHVLSEAYALGDDMATQMLAQITWALGTVYYNIYKVLDNNCFVLGGGLTNMGNPLFSGIEKTFLGLCRGKSSEDIIHFKKAHFGSDEIGIYGAFLAAKYAN